MVGRPEHLKPYIKPGFDRPGFLFYIYNMETELEERQKRFCEEYVIDLNGTQAAIRAGYSVDSAKEQACRLLTKDHVQNYVMTLKKEKGKRLKIDAAWVMKRFKKIADRCIQAEPVMIKIDGVWVNSGEYKFDSAGANKATENIAKHIGFYEKDNSQKPTVAVIPTLTADMVKALNDKLDKNV